MKRATLHIFHDRQFLLAMFQFAFLLVFHTPRARRLAAALRASAIAVLVGVCHLPVLAQEDEIFVESGRAVATGEPVELNDLRQSYMASHDIGTGDFRVYARLRLSQPGASGAAFQLGESYFGFDGPNREIHLSGALAGGRYLRLLRGDWLIKAGEWFEFEAERKGADIRFFIDGREIHRIPSLVAVGQIGFTFASVGRLPVAPAGTVLEVGSFRASGELHEAGTVKPRGFTISLIDLASETHRQVLVDREDGQYLGHPTTVLLPDGRTIIAVYPKGHGRGAVVMKKSTDGGLTWSGRLPVPENWATSQEVPTLYPVMDPEGTRRLVMFSGLYPIRMALSEDDGMTWTPLELIGDYGGIVAMSDVVHTKSGDYLAFFHDDGRFIDGNGEDRGPFFVYKVRSKDGGLSWGRPEVVVSHEAAHLCEPGLIRSSDGGQLLMLLRENSRMYNSFFAVSDDEGETWSEPVELPGVLTGDRHQAVYGPDGRLFVSFRDRTHESPTWGDWVAWVGTYDDIVSGREGQYRIRLMDNHRAADTAYPGVEILPGRNDRCDDLRPLDRRRGTLRHERLDNAPGVRRESAGFRPQVAARSKYRRRARLRSEKDQDHPAIGAPLKKNFQALATRV